MIHSLTSAWIRDCVEVKILVICLFITFLSLAYFKVTRVPLTAKGKYNNGNQRKNTPEEAVRYSSGLNSGSGATLSVSDTTCVQATTDSKSQAASDLPQCRQSESASSKPVQPTQGLTDTTSRANSSFFSRNFAPLQTTQSNTAQNVVAQAGQYLPHSVPPQPSQQVFRSLSHPLQSSLTSLLQSSSSLSGQRVLNIIPSKLQHAILMPQVVLPQSQSGVVLASAAPPVLASCPSVAQTSVSVHTASFQSSYSNILTNTQSHSLTSNQSVPSLLTSAPFAQSSQAMSNPHPSTLNSSSNHTQQSFPQSQVVSGQSFPSQTASTNKSLPYSQAVSNTQSVSLQPSQSAGTQSNHLQFTLLNVPNNIASLNSGTEWKFYHYTPVLTVKKGTTLSHVLQPTNHTWKRERNSSHPTSGKVFFPLAPRLTVPPASSNKELDPPVSIMPPIPTAPIPRDYSNAGQIECATQTIQMPSCELPVKAPADSVCEGDMRVCSRASPVAKEADSNLPTSTVPEKDTKAEELPAVHQPQDPLSTSSIKDFPPNQSFLAQSEIMKSISTLSSTGSPSTKHWLTGLPSSFREILSSEIKVPAEDACSRSALENASLPSAKVIKIMKLPNFFYGSI